MLKSSGVAVQLAASQEWVSSMKLVCSNFIIFYKWLHKAKCKVIKIMVVLDETYVVW
jgi:hypothetical protein